MTGKAPWRTRILKAPWIGRRRPTVTAAAALLHAQRAAGANIALDATTVGVLRGPRSAGPAPDLARVGEAGLSAANDG